ncbi:MAG: Bug family tripartite tricarboxylate transporter substrate binding protein [Burkholderiales bacterium]
MTRSSLLPWVLCVLSTCVAAQSYPTKPIRVVIPYAPGGGVDRMGRLMAPILGNSLGQPVIIENQGGAATMIGTSMVGRAPADGHTLLFTTNGFSVNVLVHTAPSYKVEEFVAVAPVAVFGYVLGVTPGLPVRNIQEFIAYAKKEPAKVNAGAVGAGSAMHLLNERFETLGGIVVPEVHYRGLAPALTDLMGGQVQMLFDTIGTTARQVKGGKVRALAVTSPERSPLIPDVPTFREAGMPGMTQLGWQGVFAPMGTPNAVVDRLNREIVKIATSAEIRAHFDPEGLSPLDLSREAFAKFVREDAAPWERIVKALGIKMPE